MDTDAGGRGRHHADDSDPDPPDDGWSTGGWAILPATERRGRHEAPSYDSVPLTRPVHDQPAFGRPTSDLADRLSAYEQEKESWGGEPQPSGRVGTADPPVVEPSPPPLAPAAPRRFRPQIRRRSATRDDKDDPVKGLQVRLTPE